MTTYLGRKPASRAPPLRFTRPLLELEIFLTVIILKGGRVAETNATAYYVHEQHMYVYVRKDGCAGESTVNNRMLQMRGEERRAERHGTRRLSGYSFRDRDMSMNRVPTKDVSQP
ncbi:hypothetical protein BHE74_00004954 [Ensete ventricosum]|nr:hypothetical protein BHE74_00004954 [Ensete ventricosum]